MLAIPLIAGFLATTPRKVSCCRTRLSTKALNIETATPTLRVTPKPRTGPAARANSSAAANRVVMLESAIAVSAPRNPPVTAFCIRRTGDLVPVAAAYSSRDRS